jgi:hypothetical protein
LKNNDFLAKALSGKFLLVWEQMYPAGVSGLFCTGIDRIHISLLDRSHGLDSIRRIDTEMRAV